VQLTSLLLLDKYLAPLWIDLSREPQGKISNIQRGLLGLEAGADGMCVAGRRYGSSRLRSGGFFPEECTEPMDQPLFDLYIHTVRGSLCLWFVLV
jgi:coenzyme F420-reducing hydrogenase delta subunit